MSNESTIRSRALRHGYRVSKSRRNGSFGLYDLSTRCVVLADHEGHGYSLDDIEERLNEII